jgi:hypothetical protein
MKIARVQLLYILPLAGLISLPAGNCAPGSSEVSLPSPLTKITRHGASEFFVEALPGVRLSQLVDVTVFDGLRPKLNFDEVAAILGSPQSSYLEHNRDEVRVFSSELDGRFEVVRQTVDSEGYQGERWYLRFVPKEPCAPCYVQPPILRAIPDSPQTLNLSIDTEDGQALLEFERKRLVRIWWLRDGPLILPSTDSVGSGSLRQ